MADHSSSTTTTHEDDPLLSYQFTQFQQPPYMSMQPFQNTFQPPTAAVFNPKISQPTAVYDISHQTQPPQNYQASANLYAPRATPPTLFTNNSNRADPYTPFGYVPTIASTVPIHNGNTRSGMPRRRKTGSKRSVEELLLESTIPTATNLSAPLPPQRQGPSVGLLSMDTFSHTSPTLPLTIPEPPLATATPLNPSSMKSDPQPRPKKKSKYTTEQDELILKMKKDGSSWTQISEAAQCGNSIAARNRYQVLIGQQGGGAVVWDSEDTQSFKSLLERGESAKWNFIANEMSRIRNKKTTPVACRKKIKELFETNPALFGIVLNSSSIFMPPAISSHNGPPPALPDMNSYVPTPTPTLQDKKQFQQTFPPSNSHFTPHPHHQQPHSENTYILTSGRDMQEMIIPGTSSTTGPSPASYIQPDYSAATSATTASSSSASSTNLLHK